jgi:predicted GH43/DUF377 family glycosyl hydrolase
MNFYKMLHVVFLISPYFFSYASFDFNQTQDFILESKQITIAHHPHAFNPSIIRYKGRLLLSFREIAYPTYFSWIGLVWLDENFCPEGPPQYLNMTVDSCGSEDARLIMFDQRLYIIYNGSKGLAFNDREGSEGFRMYIAELNEKDNQFSILADECLNSFEGESPTRREKNWVPFNYKENLLLAYSLSPHRILRPLLGTKSCETFDITKGDMQWQWGELRGGTPALLDDQQYLAFFHSSTHMESPFSLNASVPHYFIGAYTFTNEPPFYMTQMSASPIISEKFYESNPYQPYWHPVIVVFPCGILMDENYVWITYGKHDHEMWITKMDKKGLLNSLIPVNAVYK